MIKKNIDDLICGFKRYIEDLIEDLKYYAVEAKAAVFGLSYGFFVLVLANLWGIFTYLVFGLIISLVYLCLGIPLPWEQYSD